MPAKKQSFMSKTKETSTNLQSVNLFVAIYKWKLHLLIATVLAALAAIIFSGPAFIKPRYKAQTILFSPNTNSISALTITENPYAIDATQFGEDEETEQLMQMLNSTQLKDRTINLFDLREHYGIDTTLKDKQARLYSIFDENISIKRTEYMAVKIEVLDISPVLAADIANGMVKILDTLKSEIQKQRTQAALDIAEKEYLSLKERIRVYEDTLRMLKELGITDYEFQAERYAEQHAIALRMNDHQGIRNLEKQLEILEKYGTQYDRVTGYIWKEREYLHDVVERKYLEAKVNAENIIPATYVVQKAQVPDKKAFPVRWLIVVFAVMGTLLMGVFVALGLEYYKRVKSITVSNPI